MSVVIKVKSPSPAVQEFQVLNSFINRKIDQSSSKEERGFWSGQYQIRTNEISKQYGISVSDLVDSWVSWVDAVEVARKAVK